MNKGKTIAASFLALGFGFVSFGLLVIEPRMGFSEFADFFDPAKVMVGAESLFWLVGDFIYLGFGVALAYLALASDDRYLRASGLTAGVGFLFIASLGQLLTQLPAIINNPDHLDAALLGPLPVRFAALRTTVLALGVFAWRTTRVHAPGEAGPAAWRGLGYLILAASVVFVLVFIPIPLLFTIWAVWLAVRQARSA